MAQDTVITSLEKLKEWFFLNKRPYFTIHRGYEAKNDRVLYRNEEVDDLESSWELIEQVISSHSEAGGSFRVYVTDKPGHNWGTTTLLRLSATNPEYANTGNARVNGMGTGVGIWGIYSNPREMIEAEIKKANEVYELKREIEDLRNQQDAKIGVMDRFMENLIERPEIYQLIQQIGLKIMAGQTPPTPPPVAIGEQPGSDDPQGYDYDRIEGALDEIRTVFPDTEKTLEQLAAWVKNNPDMARSVLQSIQKPS